MLILQIGVRLSSLWRMACGASFLKYINAITAYEKQTKMFESLLAFL